MSVSRINTTVSFGRNLTSLELKEYSDVLSQGKNLAGQTGKSIFIMPSASLPQSAEYNSGVGHLSSDTAQDYLSYMKNYLGFNIVEDLPPGQIRPYRGFYCAYNSSSFALGNHQINPELLATQEYENLLSDADLKEIADANKSVTKETFANFDNVMSPEGAQNKALKKAFDKFQQLDAALPIKKRYNEYIKENAFWLDFPREQEPSLEFFKFKQFLADEHLKIAKDKLNAKGIKLYGDCLIGFSKDETAAFPNAFKKDCFIGLPDWKLPALNYDEILDESSEAAKVLKQKVQLFAKRYDSIRFDVGWAYVTPIITPKDVQEVRPENKKEMGSALLDKIENWVKEVKGDNFDTKNLIYEFDAGVEEFRAFGSDGRLIRPLQNRVKIYGTTYMHNSNGDTWGYNKAFLDRGWSPDDFILGVGNHDPQPLRQIANDVPEEVEQGVFERHKQPAIKPLSEELKIPQEKLQNPVEFAKAKWAEPMMAKNNQAFFMDVFGREERFDMQWKNVITHPERNYAYKVPTDFKTAYQRAIKEGFGFNPMDALQKVFVAKGLDKTHPDLFKKIVKYNQILQSSEGELEKAAKNKSIMKYSFLVFGFVAGGIYAYTKFKYHENKQNLRPQQMKAFKLNKK